MNEETTELERLKRAVLLKRIKARTRQEQPSAWQQGILPADRSQALPLSWSQQRLWFLDRLDAAAGAA
ncbi:hypothetical protein, partial [Xanthomonas sp. 1678]|uniref:hypothetical protein n=1 Tax=Xanthomonas sp. 1678 TaxID=3158788 RepID=UPI00285C305D|nr:hypothetical protein [Xanthomonas translucens]